MNPSISLRPATEADDPFLMNLYKTVRGPEFAQVPLLPEQLDSLLTSQYELRKAAYESTYPESLHSIVLSGEAPIGQFWVDRSGGQILVVDIALMPEHRSTGIGARLMQDLIAEAQKTAVPLVCSVATNNPGSLRFHQRLGFEITSQDPMYYQMEYRVAG